MNDLSVFAASFLRAFDDHQAPTADLSIDALSIEDAYSVQQLVIERRSVRGEQPVGYKVGCTSAAIRQQFGLSEPICGRIMDPFVTRGDATLDMSDYIQPAIEPEFVLTVGKDLDDVPSDDQHLLDAIKSVSAGIEVHNYHFWFGQPTIQELIASNGIHANLVIGDQHVGPYDVDWVHGAVSVMREGATVTSGVAADIMGGPLHSLRWLIAHLVEHGSGLRAGDIVIPGSAVELVPVASGDRIVAEFGQLGSVEVTFR
jgi:2-keto-4-pentenoate hydratase